MKIKALMAAGFLCLSPALAQAYIGPGLGAGTIGIILGFIASIFLALFAILWYPIKRLVRKIRGTKDSEGAGKTSEQETKDA